MCLFAVVADFLTPPPPQLRGLPGDHKVIVNPFASKGLALKRLAIRKVASSRLASFCSILISARIRRKHNS